jgi:hypothetical protein
MVAVMLAWVTALLICTTVARADVDMTGALERITHSTKKHSTKSAVSPESATRTNGQYRCEDKYSVVANFPYYYAIGNCPKGEVINVVSYASENPATGEHSYGGKIKGGFEGCGWINTSYPVEKLNNKENTECSEGSNGSFKVEESTFWEKLNNTKYQDGSSVVNPKPCEEYANYRPWSKSSHEVEPIREVPAYAASQIGSTEPALKWRYTTKYDSTDGTGQYVMVRDDRITGAGEGNWVFVPRSCLKGSLPEENESMPAPVATTGSAGSITPIGATLHGTMATYGMNTEYYFEYGTSEGEGTKTTTASSGDGPGTTQVEASLSTGELKPSTRYYFSLIARGPTGTNVGAQGSFTTAALTPPSVTTGSWTNLTETGATVSGTLNPNYSETHYSFQYGTSESYGSETGEVDVGSGNEGKSASASISNLGPRGRLLLSVGRAQRSGHELRQC